MMETAKIRKSGYAVRYDFKDFVERFQILIKPPQNSVNNRRPLAGPQELCQRICAQYLPQEDNFYQFGLTKVFLKDDTLIEREREKVFLAKVIMIQRWYRQILRQKRQRRRVWAAIVIQKHWRARGYRTRFLIMRQGLLRLQAVLRSRQLSATYEKRKRVVTGLQAHCRGFLTRRRLHHRIDSKTKRLIELTIIRRQEELQFRRAGHRNWRELAEVKYHERVTNVLQAEQKRRLEEKRAVEAKRALERQKSEEERKRVEADRRRVNELKRAEETRKLDEKRRLEDARRVEDERRRLYNEAKAAEDRRRYDEQLRMEENKRKANQINGQRYTTENGYHRPEDRRSNSRLAEEIKFIDDEFEFLQESTPSKPVPPPRGITMEKKKNNPTITVKKMKSFFEEQSKNMKQIPTKLLSRPAQTYSSRL